MKKKELLLCFLIFFFASGARAQFAIIEHSPLPNSSTTCCDLDVITITFSNDVDAHSLEDGVFIYGSKSGRINGSFMVSSNRATFTPQNDLIYGERISVYITKEVLSQNGEELESSYSWSYDVTPLHGSFEFEEPFEIQLRPGSEPSGVIAVDLNNNSESDLVVINSNNTLVTILENSFAEGTGFEIVDEIDTGIEIIAKSTTDDLQVASSGMSVNSGVTVADLSRDGNSDVIIASTLSNQIIILRNSNGNSENLQVELFDTGERPVDLVPGDFNGNGYLDIAVVSYGRDRIYIHHNDGTGNFNDTDIYSVGLAPISIAAEDINNNGALDLIVAVSGDRRVEGLISQGDGSFIQEVLIDDLAFTPSFMVAGNFVKNAESNLIDIVLGSSDEREFYVYENNAGNFGFHERRSTGASSRPLNATAVDIFSDGNLELVTASYNSNELFISTFTPGEIGGNQIVVSDEVINPLGLASSDFTMSGAMDIAVTNPSTHSLTLFLNEGDPGFIELEDIVLEYPEIIDFGIVETNTTADTVFQLHNHSEFTFDISLELLNGNYFVLESADSFVLDANSYQSIELSFSPEQIAEYTDELFLRIHLPFEVHTLVIDVLGEGTEPLPDLVAKDLFHGSVPTDFFTGFSYEFTGVLINDGIRDVNEPFDVAFLVDGVTVHTIRVTDTVESDQRLVFNFDHTFFDPGSSTISFIVDVEEEIEERDLSNNEISLEVDIKESLPDLVAESFTVLDQVSEYLVGAEYRFLGEVMNDGLISVEEPFFVHMSVDGETVSTLLVTDSIEPGERINLRFNHTFLQPGAKEISFTIDPENEIRELDVTNNQLSINLSIRSQIIDLIAEDFYLVSHHQEEHLVGVPHTFEGTLVYQGDLSLDKSFDVHFLVNREVKSTFRVRERIEPGQSLTFGFEYVFDEARTFELSFSVDPNDEVEDTDRTNNEKTLLLRVIEGRVFVTPNPFTPNNDGFNDVLEFDMTQIADIHDPQIQIFSFNGRLVKTLSADAFDGASMYWDGRDQNGNVLRPGVYLYVIENNNSLLHRGAVTLAL
ncbi:CARDB domain-containing protein [Balneolaceae bacterium ANBcel3]|nr:CARDB domain-containing protein [Balneolaceae bacterium ANBcel3]